jgi:ssDNA-binding Zn-finger/Zn-ribbon topoisomerase 1
MSDNKVEDYPCPSCGSKTDTVTIKGKPNFIWSCNNPKCDCDMLQQNLENIRGLKN